MTRVVLGIAPAAAFLLAHLAIHRLARWAREHDQWRWDDTPLEQRHWWVRLDADRPARTINHTKENRHA